MTAITYAPARILAGGFGRHAWICIGLVLFTVASFWHWAPHHFYIEGGPAFGEALVAYLGGQNLHLFGWQFAGLQDVQTSADPSATRVLYIHHPNFGMYVSYALFKVGITQFEMQNALSIVASLAGLVMAYVLILHLTASRALALIFTLLLALDRNFILYWSFNIHRAFTYLSVFGTIYAFVRYCESGCRSAMWLALTALAGLTLLGTDYMFFFFIFFALAAYPIIARNPAPIKCLMTLCLIFGGLFVLRQLQVIAGLGWSAWTHDFLFQVVNRLHLDFLLNPDWQVGAGEFYRVYEIVNPGFTAYQGPLQRVAHFITSLGRTILTGGIGLEGPPLLLSRIAGLAILLAFGARLSFELVKGRLTGMLRFGAMLAFASIMMLIVFPAYFANWFGEFLLAPICAYAWLVAAASPRPAQSTRKM